MRWFPQFLLSFPSFSPVAAFHSFFLSPAFPIQQSFSCSSVLLFFHFLFFLIFSFPRSLALLDLNLSSPCSSSFSISTYLLFLFSPPFLPLLFLFWVLPPSSFSYPNYINVMISSIFLVISWERCSPLPHFIHPCIDQYMRACVQTHGCLWYQWRKKGRKKERNKQVIKIM